MLAFIIAVNVIYTIVNGVLFIQKKASSLYNVNVELSFSIFYLCELVCKFLALGPSRFFTLAHLMDTFFTSSLFVLNIVVVNKEQAQAVAVAIAFFRVTRIIQRVDYLSIFFSTFRRLVVTFLPVIAIIFAFQCFFSFVGMMSFGGRLYEGNKLLLNSTYAQADYYVFNFNDCKNSSF